MTYTIFKLGLSAAVIAAVSEIAKSSSLVGGLLASLPLTSLLGFVWLWQDSRDTQKVAAPSNSILWLVLPSLVLFLVLPVLLKRGVHFYPALGTAVAAMLVAYGAAMVLTLDKVGIKP